MDEIKKNMESQLVVIPENDFIDEKSKNTWMIDILGVPRIFFFKAVFSDT